MKRYFTVACALVAGFLAAGQAQAGGRVHWSVNVASPGYIVTQPGVVVPQPQYSYGPPPSAFAQPPAVVYVQPTYPVYPVYPVYPPPVLYVDPFGRAIEPHHSHRHNNHHQGRNDWDNRGGHWRR